MRNDVAYTAPSMPIVIAAARSTATTVDIAVSVQARNILIHASLSVEYFFARCRLVNRTGGIVIEATTPIGGTDVLIMSHEAGISASCVRKLINTFTRHF